MIVDTEVKRGPDNRVTIKFIAESGGDVVEVNIPLSLAHRLSEQIKLNMVKGYLWKT